MPKVHVTPVEEGIFRLTMDDPKNGNRLGEELYRELMSALEDLSRDGNLKVLIISGRKDVFCAGGSLDFLRKLAVGKTDERDLFALPHRLLSFPLPIIAEMQGHAVGGGLTLALFCDITVAAEGSRYGVNFTSMGFTPGMGTTAVLPALAGHHFAVEMIFTAKIYKGKELRGRGLFNYVVPACDVSGMVTDIARRMAEKPRYVLEMLKDTMSLPRRRALQSAMTSEQMMHKTCFGQPGTAELIETSYLR
jgi:polyketide biosynthesis enoyl-CoA hydratase PksI